MMHKSGYKHKLLEKVFFFFFTLWRLQFYTSLLTNNFPINILESWTTNNLKSTIWSSEPLLKRFHMRDPRFVDVTGCNVGFVWPYKIICDPIFPAKSPMRFSRQVTWLQAVWPKARKASHFSKIQLNLPNTLEWCLLTLRHSWKVTSMSGLQNSIHAEGESVWTGI